MKRDFSALGNGEFDLAIIGGGAFGAAAAWDATLRGLRTVVIERNDFGGGASAECFKVVHGGIRYLQHGNISRLRSSCHERSAMLRIAPHLVTPLPILVPTFGWGRQGKLLLGSGMRVYDALSWDRNTGIRDRSRHIQPTQFLTRTELLREFPDLERPGLTGGAVFEDGQMYNAARLVLAFVKSAVNAGATACNYAEASGFLWNGDRIAGVHVRDRLEGGECTIRARLVLNAAGPGAEYLLAAEQRFGPWQRGCFSRDAYFIVNRQPRSRYALAIPGQSRDRDALLSRAARHLFAVPWRDVTLIGVWHRVFTEHPDTAAVEEQELESWIDEIRSVYPELHLARDDVTLANCGLVPFGNATSTTSNMSFGKESRIIDHRASHGVAGLVTLIGIRFTMARIDAARALDLLLKQLPKAPPSAPTDATPLAGGDIADFAALKMAARRALPAVVEDRTVDALVRNHGTEYDQVLAPATRDASDGQYVTGTGTLRAEISHAVDREMAVRLEDVVMRRTDLGSARHPGHAAIDVVAKHMQRLLGWTETRRRAEVADIERVLSGHLAPAAAPAALDLRTQGEAV